MRSLRSIHAAFLPIPEAAELTPATTRANRTSEFRAVS